MAGVQYLAVAASSGEVLVERQVGTGSAPDVVRRLLPRVIEQRAAKGGGGGSGRRTFNDSSTGYAFRLAWGPSGYIFVCHERGLGDQAVWRLLGCVRQRWERHGVAAGMVAGSTSPSAAASFGDPLVELLDRANSADGSDGACDPEGQSRAVLGTVQQQLEAVRSVMADSIEKVVERGVRARGARTVRLDLRGRAPYPLALPALAWCCATAPDRHGPAGSADAVHTLARSLASLARHAAQERIELLVDRAGRLEQNATRFARSSAGLRREYRWRELKCRLIMVAAGLAIVVVLLASACGSADPRQCRVALREASDQQPRPS